MIRVEASAPSNIALIKHMGKGAGEGNLPANSSLSYTLEHLRTFVVIEESAGGQDEWAPLANFAPLQLSPTGLAKYLKHFERLKNHWGLSGHYKILSANNFPSDCGLASSASSFAALTQATYQLAGRQHAQLRCSLAELSSLSRTGSGSSCRSFFSPWALWSGEDARPVDLNLRLEHAVIVVEDGKKAVSSSEAHARITSSKLWAERAARAEQRLQELMAALRTGKWQTAFDICWNEFWDMHALFETSRPPFGYMTQNTLMALNRLRQIWNEQDGPLVTMDAGANIHLLLRTDQLDRAQDWLKGFRTLRSWSE